MGSDLSYPSIREPGEDGLHKGGEGDFGRLSCTLGTLVQQDVAGEGRTPREILQAVEPSVAAVIKDDLSAVKWWGLDANDVVVAGLEESATGGRYEVSTCSG